MHKYLSFLFVILPSIAVLTFSSCQTVKTEVKEDPAYKTKVIERLMESMKYEENVKKGFDDIFLYIRGNVHEELRKVIAELFYDEKIGRLSKDSKVEILMLENEILDRWSLKMTQNLREAVSSKTIALELYYEIYGKYFSTEELEELIAFYNSKTGQKLVNLMPTIVGDLSKTTNKQIYAYLKDISDDIWNQEMKYFDTKLHDILRRDVW